MEASLAEGEDAISAVHALQALHQHAAEVRGLQQELTRAQHRLDALDAATGHLPGLHLTGAAYRGIGLASCVANAKRTARDVAHDVRQPPADVRPLTEVNS